MIAELIIHDVHQMNQCEIEDECSELEDSYAEALKDNAGFDVLNTIWKRIQELQRQLARNHTN